MAGDKKTSFTINAENKTDSAFKKASDNLKNLTGNVNGSARSMDSLRKGVKTAMDVLPVVGFATVAAVALKKVASAALEAEDAFAKVDVAERRLDFATSLNAKLGTTSTALKKFAGQLSGDLKNTFAGGDILALISPMAFDKSATEIKKLTTVAADLSSALGQDLTQSLGALQSTLTGKVSVELKKFFPELATFTKAQLEAGAAVDYLEKKVRGTSAALAEGATGSLTRYKNSMGDLKEELGGVVTGYFQPVRNWLSSLAEGWTNALAAKRNYANAKMAEEKGTADVDQQLTLLGQSKNVVRMKAFQPNMEIASGRKWDDNDDQDQVDYLKLVSYFLENKNNSRAGIMPEASAQSQFGMTTSAVKAAFDAFSKQYTTAEQMVSGYSGKIADELSEFRKAQSAYDSARVQANQDQKSAEARAAKERADSIQAQNIADALKMGLDASVLKIQNKMADGSLDKLTGERQISDLTDNKYLEALNTRDSSDSSAEQITAATNYLYAYSESWKIKATNEQIEKQKKDAEEAEKKAAEIKKEQEKEADLKKEYAKRLNDIIKTGLSPAQRSLAEFNEKNNELIQSLNDKIRNGLATDEESRAAFLLGGEKKDLEKGVTQEGEGKGLLSSVFGAIKGGEGASSIGQIISGGAEAGGISAILGPLGAAIGPLAGAFGMLMQIMNPLQTIFGAMFEVLAPVIESLLAPILGILKILGMFLGNLLVPVFKLLEPPIAAITKAFVWLYNSVLVPVGNGIMKLFADVGNFFIKIINGVIDALNHIPWVDIGRVRELEATQMAKISINDVVGAGSSSSGGSSGGATYSGAKDVYINIYYDKSFVNGDAREIALALRKEIQLAEAMGY